MGSFTLMLKSGAHSNSFLIKVGWSVASLIWVVNTPAPTPSARPFQHPNRLEYQPLERKGFEWRVVLWYEFLSVAEFFIEGVSCPRFVFSSCCRSVGGLIVWLHDFKSVFLTCSFSVCGVIFEARSVTTTNILSCDHAYFTWKSECVPVPYSDISINYAVNLH